MQFRDLGKQYEVLKKEIDEAVEKVMESSRFISGPQVKELEQQLAKFVGVKHCVTCANGTDALTLALKVWNIGKGDAVFVPDFTFFSTAEVVGLEGAAPVFVDVDENTYNISPESLEKSIVNTLAESKLTPKAIIAVDLFGQPANFPEIRKIADKYGLLLLEDGAQGFGGAIGNKRACSFGDISTTSFFPAKPLGCYGDGGAVFTDNDEWAKLLRSYAVHGKGEDKYDNVRIGMNSRLDTIQAAILQIKLKAFEDYELNDVNKAASWYNEMLPESLKKPEIPDGFYSSWAQYTVQFKDEKQRDAVQNKLKENGIPSMIYYKKAMHEEGAFSQIHYNGDCSVTSRLCKTVLSFPMHPYMKKENVKIICNIINEILCGGYYEH